MLSHGLPRQGPLTGWETLPKQALPNKHHKWVGSAASLQGRRLNCNKWQSYHLPSHPFS